MDSKILALVKYVTVAIVTLAISYWIFVVMRESDTSSLTLTNGTQRLSFTYIAKRGLLNISELFDSIQKNKNDAVLLEALLNSRGFFKSDDPKLVNHLENLPENHDVSIRLRELAASQNGPFRPTRYKAKIRESEYIKNYESAAACPKELYRKYILIPYRNKMVSVYTDTPMPCISENTEIAISPKRMKELGMVRESIVYNVISSCSNIVPDHNQTANF